MKHSYHTDGTLPEKGEIFVFGSNDAGVHGKGAALLAATQFGAIRGIGDGLVGQSYAIATRHYDPKTRQITTLPLNKVIDNIHRFCLFTTTYRPYNQLKWWVTSVGCGYAGFQPSDIAPHFQQAVNCSFPVEWMGYLEY